MSVIEKFVVFAKTLPEDRLREIEEMLKSIMDSESSEFEFTDEEMAELDRRMADPNPQYANPAEVAAVFRSFDRN